MRYLHVNALRRKVLLLALLALAPSASPVWADVVTDWNATAIAVTTAAGLTEQEKNDLIQHLLGL